MKDLSTSGAIFFKDFELGVFNRLPDFRIVPERMRPVDGHVRIAETRSVIVRFELDYIGAGFAGQLDVGGRFKAQPESFRGDHDELLIEELNPGSLDLSGRFFSFPRAALLPTARFVDSGDGQGKRLRLEFDLQPSEVDEYMEFLHRDRQ